MLDDIKLYDEDQYSIRIVDGFIKIICNNSEFEIKLKMNRLLASDYLGFLML